MKHEIRLLLAVALCLSGCASTYSVTVGPEPVRVYGGVHLDGSIIAAAASNGQVDCGLQDCESSRVWMLASAAICDLPLSLIGDTVLLPYTLIASAAHAWRQP